MAYNVFTQACPPPAESEKLDLTELGVLDKDTLTSVVDFMHKFQDDATFSPPTIDVMFDTDKYELDIDSIESEDEVLGQWSEIEDLKE